MKILISESISQAKDTCNWHQGIHLHCHNRFFALLSTNLAPNYCLDSFSNVLYSCWAPISVNILANNWMLINKTWRYFNMYRAGTALEIIFCPSIRSMSSIFILFCKRFELLSSNAKETFKFFHEFGYCQKKVINFITLAIISHLMMRNPQLPRLES